MGTNSRIDWPRHITSPAHIEVGNNSRIHKNATIIALMSDEEDSPKVSVGNGTYIGMNVFIACKKSIVISDHCVLSDNIFISDTSHGLTPTAGPILGQALTPARPIVIESGTFIGRNSFIAPGVILGKHSVVGAYSVVTRSVPAKTMVAGNPAKVVKRWSEITEQWESCRDS
jgi:acetyltransferase-like isoleucine patch superfamily enzyme